MQNTKYLYQVAEKKNIPILIFPLPETGSLCYQDDDGRCYIGMDYSTMETSAEERVHLAHELGHCLTGAFYNRWSEYDIRAKHERRADKWAIKKFVPKDELDAAVLHGYKEPWELAEHFNVTEPFIVKAVEYYKMLDEK